MGFQYNITTIDRTESPTAERAVRQRKQATIILFVSDPKDRTGGHTFVEFFPSLRAAVNNLRALLRAGDETGRHITWANIYVKPFLQRGFVAWEASFHDAEAKGDFLRRLEPRALFDFLTDEGRAYLSDLETR